VYVLDNPLGRKKGVWHPTPVTVAQNNPANRAATPPPPPATSDTSKNAGGGSALYRSAQGLRRADSVTAVPDSIRALTSPSMAQLIDSAKLALPDTSTFVERRYKPVYTPDYVARPSIGFTRGTYSQGFYGGTSISLSDMLGDHQMVFAGYVNGRIDEAQ